MSKSIDFYNVGQLKDAIKNMPDNTMLFFQVVAKDGGAWNLHCEISYNQDGFATISLTHDELLTLDNVNTQLKKQ